MSHQTRPALTNAVPNACCREPVPRVSFRAARTLRAPQSSRKQKARLTILAALSDKRPYADYATGRVYMSAVNSKKVGEIREELVKRKADTTGTKVQLVDRLFHLMQTEAADMQASAQMHAQAPPHPVEQIQRPARTLAEMGSKLSLRSISARATQAQRAAKLQGVSSVSSTPSLTKSQDKALPEPQQQLPGYSAAQAVRKVLIKRVAQAKQKQRSDAAHLQQQQQQQELQAQQDSFDQADVVVDHDGRTEHAQTSATSPPGVLSEPVQPRAQKPWDSPAGQAVQQEPEGNQLQQHQACQWPEQQPNSEQPISPHSLAQQPLSQEIVTGQQLNKAVQREYDPWFADPDHEPGVKSRHLADSASTASSELAELPQVVSEPVQQRAQMPWNCSPDQAVEQEAKVSQLQQQEAQQVLAQQPLSPQSLAEQRLSQESVNGQQQDSAVQQEYDRWFDDPDYEPDPDLPDTAELPDDAERQDSHAFASTSDSSSSSSNKRTRSRGRSSDRRHSSKKGGSVSYDSRRLWKASEDEELTVNSNGTGMQISFLGTAGKPGCRTRSQNCVAIRTQQAVMLFNCGEDVQRQLMAQPQITHGRINRIFITDLSSANINGLAGLLITLSWSREQESEDASIPVHVYGPPGIAQYIRDMMLLSDTRFLIPILVHELFAQPCKTNPERLQVASERSPLYKVRVPPDQLNPEGWYDGFMTADFLRDKNRRLNKRTDLRASTKPMKLPPPGNPQRQDLSVQDMSWTIYCDHETVVTAFPLSKDALNLSHWQSQHQQIGYTLQEADRAGSLDVVKAQELGVPPGRAYASLKEGEAVLAEDGTWVQPEQVVAPDQQGRCIAILGGDSNSLAAALPWTQHAHILVLNTDLQEQDGSEATTAVGTAIAEVATAAKAEQLLLTKLSDDKPTINELVRHIRTVCQDSVTVVPAQDHMVLCLDRR